MRVLIDQDPFIRLNDTSTPWKKRGDWPCSWIAHPAPGDAPFFTAYRLPFTLDNAATIRTHVSADERYELYLDGQLIGRGPERGDPVHWFYESYDLAIAPGDHMLVARVWTLGTEMAPVAQMSVHPGFIFAPEGDFTTRLGTGLAPWETKLLGGMDFIHPNPAWGTGYNLTVDAAQFDWGFTRGAGDGWIPAQTLQPGVGYMTGTEFYGQHLLQPATLPPMLNEPRQVGVIRYVGELPDAHAVSYDARPVNMAASHTDEVPAWTAFLSDQQPVTVPPHTVRQVIIDLEDYYCGYPALTVSGGAGSTLKIWWEEALHVHPDPWQHEKGNRNEIDGKYFVGTGDTFLPDGSANRCFAPFWWQAGRYVALIVQTADQAVTLHDFTLYETRYPLERETAFAASNPRLETIIPYMVRGLQMCTHETYMDCPYYEQLMYVGDTRLEVLVTYMITHDDRMPRKALRMFQASQLASGMTQARYPNIRDQVIPPFALWWVGMVSDYALWRDDRPFVEDLMPSVRAVLDGFGRYLNAKGLIEGPPGWNVTDWVPNWEGGNPPDGAFGVSAIINWQYVHILNLAASLEALLGETELAARNRRRATELAARLDIFWNAERGLFADDLKHEFYSEHAQCLAILSGALDENKRARLAETLFTADDLERTTIYFSHYLFETFRVLGRIDALLDRLDLWVDQVNYGAKTTIEKPEPSRSDCHAWGAHPLFHYYASLIGIRPANLGFATVAITPQLGSLTAISGTLPHPHGEITADLRVENGALHGTLILPDGVTGTLRANGTLIDLHDGEQTF